MANSKNLMQDGMGHRRPLSRRCRPHRTNWGPRCKADLFIDGKTKNSHHKKMINHLEMGCMNYVALFEIENQTTITIRAVRHQREAITSDRHCSCLPNTPHCTTLRP